MKWTPGRDIIEAFRLGLREPIWRRTAVASFVLLLPLYAIMLPTSLTGGYIGWVSLRNATGGALHGRWRNTFDGGITRSPHPALVTFHLVRQLRGRGACTGRT